MTKSCKHWYGIRHDWQYKAHAWDIRYSDCFIVEKCSVCGMERTTTYDRYTQKPYDVLDGTGSTILGSTIK